MAKNKKNVEEKETFTKEELIQKIEALQLQNQALNQQVLEKHNELNKLANAINFNQKLNADHIYLLTYDVYFDDGVTKKWMTKKKAFINYKDAENYGIHYSIFGAEHRTLLHFDIEAIVLDFKYQGFDSKKKEEN